ncbi:MAG TPA: peptidoglycan DD-metalloendopeptidase family protein [Bacillota bacterium]|nr:peptidoglycan DD-metalloendopeptidase family protein [Bacillota bacterium]
MPPKFEGLRRLPGTERPALIDSVRQWLLRQSVLRLVLMGAAVYFILVSTAYAAFGPNACAVMVNGKTIAVAASEKSARNALRALIEIKSGRAGRPVAVAEKISYRGIRINQKEILDDQEALKNKLNDALTYTVKAAAIVVNGEEKVFLKEKEDAEKLLAWLKTLYPAEVGEQVEFKEKIEVTVTSARMESVLELEAAKKLVLLGTNKEMQYTVRDGDTLWDIARSVKIDMDQIVLTNPGIDQEHLDIGQVLYLSKEAPLITVAATRTVTLTEEVPYQVEVKYDEELLPGEKQVIAKGEPGERIVTYRIMKENGLETGREVLEETVIRQAKTEVVAKNPNTILASRGGIRLDWPCYGGTVSYFGMRWGRMHEGVDLGAGYGSDIGAAAGGIVVSAGWNGGYGKMVEISHGGGVVTRYAHLSTINVSVGERVERGEVIGLAGATGNASGPHLHFEVLINGSPRDPLNYLY